MNNITNEVPDGYVLLERCNGTALHAACMDGGRFHGWLFAKGPDGQWVSQRKLESWEVMQVEDQRDNGIVHETSADLRAALAIPASTAALDQRFIADLARSRTKYPATARMFDGLMGEVDELRRAYGGDGDRTAEAFDVAVVAYRIATEGDEGGNVSLASTAASEQQSVANINIGGCPFCGKSGTCASDCAASEQQVSVSEKYHGGVCADCGADTSYASHWADCKLFPARRATIPSEADERARTIADDAEFKRVLGSYVDGVAGQYELIAVIDEWARTHRATTATHSATVKVLQAALAAALDKDAATPDIATTAADQQGAAQAQAGDVARLNFMVQHEAWVAFGKDGESCRVFSRNEDGDAVPMLGWGARHWRHDPREAIDAAIAAMAAPATSNGGKS